MNLCKKTLRIRKKNVQLTKRFYISHRLGWDLENVRWRKGDWSCSRKEANIKPPLGNSFIIREREALQIMETVNGPGGRRALRRAVYCIRDHVKSAFKGRRALLKWKKRGMSSRRNMKDASHTQGWGQAQGEYLQRNPTKKEKISGFYVFSWKGRKIYTTLFSSA